MKSPMQNRGFTLLELLVTIAIIAVLAALTFGVMRSVKEAGHAAECAGNFRNVGVAIFQYAADNNGLIPPGNEIENSGTTGLYLSANGLSQPTNKAFLAWVYQKMVNDTTPDGRPIKGFACPAAVAKWPGLLHPTSKNPLLIYALNPRVGPDGAYQPIFGYYPGFQDYQKPMRLVTAQSVAIEDPDPRIDQRWFYQEADQMGGVSAWWDAGSFPNYHAPTPSHGNYRHRLCLDGHVEKLGLEESTIPMLH